MLRIYTPTIGLILKGRFGKKNVLTLPIFHVTL
jgi:hypothetical protein